MTTTTPAVASRANEKSFKDKEKPTEIRSSNIIAAKAVSDAIRTSLGPKGMDKMIEAANGDVTITNDGATILKQMQVLHPAAKMLVELSKAQDVEAGDGTTSVVVLAGSLLDAADKLLKRGIHPSAISDSFQRAASKCIEILESLAIPVNLEDRDTLIKAAATSLNSKVVSQHSSLLAPIAVDAVLKVSENNNADLRDVKIIKKLGGTLDDTQMFDGLVLPQKFANDFGSKKVEKAKIGLIQFCVSPPKTDMDNQVVISDYTQMDRILREERLYILNIVKQVKKAGCNVLLIQKSILRDALNEMAIHFFNKAKIAVVRDVEREDIEFVCKALGCRPIASLDHFVPEALASADLVEEVPDAKFIRFSGVSAPSSSGTVNVVIRGSNKLVLEEADRSLHDALCVIRCLVIKPALITGGGSLEIELSQKLAEYSRSLVGLDGICFRAFADALEIIPYTLAENAGLNPIATVTELRNRHANGSKYAGINVRLGTVTDILAENVIQPLQVSISAINLASETVRSLLKIDDIVHTVR
ncbi:PREDICTED: T-complex protein 1 subunit delta-like [Rhagoletis zephyria]|uniref:T-complex protein 1 subunit delta-like n=1 Tax=Rhagoletis zephyria TaxID=28612 RepID=UPI00081176B5|nr:PREDICTED: T-complex protein 1 subunit delta-like [Rhagoletis zephyria]KAH9394519.1 T-complex protein 1 subunit delta [Tyrophagus putrescentiae]